MPSDLRWFPREGDWLEDRKESLGASEIASVLGGRLDPLTLWAQRTGKETATFPPLLGLVGRALERVSYAYLADGQPQFQYKPAESARWVHAAWVTIRRGRVHHSPDSLVLENGVFLDSATSADVVRFAEHKTLDRLMESTIEEGPERYAWVQSQIGLALLGQDVCTITYLVGNGFDAERDFRVFEVERDRSFGEAAVTWAEDFWDSHIKPDIPPKPHGIDGFRRTLGLLFPPRKPRREGILPSGWWDRVQRLRALRFVIAAMDRERKGIEAEIEFAMAEAGLDQASVAVPDGVTASAPSFSRIEIQPCTVPSFERQGHVQFRSRGL